MTEDEDWTILQRWRQADEFVITEAAWTKIRCIKDPVTNQYACRFVDSSGQWADTLFGRPVFVCDNVFHVSTEARMRANPQKQIVVTLSQQCKLCVTEICSGTSND
jgi:hypothetical protein